MEKTFAKKKFFTNLARYALYFVLVLVTPYFAKPIVPLFDWVGYGQMAGFVFELFTALFWAVELIILLIVEIVVRKKQRKRILQNADADGALANAMEKRGNEPLDRTLDASFKSWVKAKDEAEILQAQPQKKKGEKQPPLPLWNVLLLAALTIACVALISVQTGFQVKPIYDIGEKVTGHQLLNKIGILIRNCVKCVFISLLLRESFEMADAIVGKDGSKWYVWLIGAAFVLAFGVFDVIRDANPFWWTYLIFYVAFTAVYALTKRNIGKTFALVLFIYIF